MGGGAWQASKLLSPKFSEPARRQLSIADGVLDVLMSQVRLQRACVVTLIGERIAAGVSEHVRMDLESQLGRYACPLDHSRKARRSERRAAL